MVQTADGLDSVVVGWWAAHSTQHGSAGRETASGGARRGAAWRGGARRGPQGACCMSRSGAAVPSIRSVRVADARRGSYGSDTAGCCDNHCCCCCCDPSTELVTECFSELESASLLSDQRRTTTTFWIISCIFWISDIRSSRIHIDIDIDIVPQASVWFSFGNYLPSSIQH